MNYMKKNLVFSVIMLVAGATLLITGFVIEANREANPMFFGLGCGFGAAGLTSTIQIILTLKNPKKCEQIELITNEERTVFLREKTNSQVYSIFIYVECIAVIITSFLEYWTLTKALSFLLLAKLITWMIVGIINGKKY